MFISLDQLSSRIFSPGKICIIEETAGGRIVYQLEQKLPMRNPPSIRYFPTEISTQDILKEIEAERDRLYYIVPPKMYYRATLSLPFRDRERVEKVLKYEVLESLPLELSNYVVAFFQLENGRSNGRLTPFQTYVATKDNIRGIVNQFGKYIKSLRGLIPEESLYYAFLKNFQITGNRLFIDVRQDAIVLLLLTNSGIFKCSTLELDGVVLPRQEFVFLVQALLRDFTGGVVILNMRRGINTDLLKQVEYTLNELGIKYRLLGPKDFPLEKSSVKVGHLYDMIPAFGLLYQSQLGILSSANFLKEEFKPRFSGRLRLKEMLIVIALLVIIGALGLTRVGLEASYYKIRATELEDAINKISLTVFKNTNIDAVQIKRKIKELEENKKLMGYLLDNRYGASGLLEEVAFLIPGDVKIDFRELVINRDMIRFSGNTTSFAEVDKLKEAFETSDVFESVKIVSSSTTGSREGYTVSFVIEIIVKTGP